MYRRLILVGAMLFVIALGVGGRAFADDAFISTTFSSLAPQDFVHEDDDPWKGWAYVEVYNDTDEWWTDFHFGIKSVQGSNISATIFIDYPPYVPTSSQSGLTWIINNDPAGATMDLFFESNPVAPDTSAWFKVYTDNTTYRQRFGICVYPTIPEPSGLLALAAGVSGLAGLVWRRRS